MALDVTAAFTGATRAKARRVTARVLINFTDLLLDETVSASTDVDENRVSVLQQTVNGKASTTYKFFSLDGVAILDGSYHPAPGTDELRNFVEIGFWGNEFSSVAGLFAVDPVITTTFGTRAVSSILVIGDTKRNEYPVDFALELISDDGVERTLNITGNTDVSRTVTLSGTLSGINSLRLTIKRWSTPGTVAKLTELSTAIVQNYDASDIEKLSVVEQREISNENSIPIGNIAAAEASLSLININRWFDANNETSPIYQSVKPNAKVDIEVGVWTGAAFEFVPLFTGWTRGWNVPERSVIAQVAARDRLDLLRQTRFSTSTVVEGRTFGSWFQTVLNDAGLSGDEFQIDPELNTSIYTVPFGWFTDISHRSALERLATACAASVYQDRNGIIQVKSILSLAKDQIAVGDQILTESGDSLVTELGTRFIVTEASEQATPVWTFDRSDYVDKNNQPIYENLANRIRVTTQPLVKTTGQTVYETSISQPEDIEADQTKTVTIFFNEPPISDAVASIDPPVSGVSIVSQTAFAWGMDIQVQNTNPTAQTFTFVVTGSTFEVKGQQTVVATDVDSIAENGEQTFTFPANPFLQVKSLASEIADSLLAYFSDPERDLAANFEPGGDPSLELGDRIAVTDLYQTKEYSVIEQTIDYRGGLSIQIRGRTTDSFVFRITEEGDERITEEGGFRSLE